MVKSLRLLARPTLGASTYALVVAATATAGFTRGSTITILLAAVLALPASVLALPGYYVAYGILALVPGASPSSSLGSGSCAPDGSCHGSVAGEPAVWFTTTTHALGILALTAAALLNVVVVRTVMARQRRRAGA